MPLQSLVSVAVRSEDIDHFGHLTFSRYADYYSLGWLELLRKAGTYPPEMVRNKQGVFVIENTIKYLHQVKPDSTLTIESHFLPCTDGKLFLIAHTMNCEKSVVSTSTNKNVFVDLSGEKPKCVPIPDCFMKLLKRESYE